MGKSARNIFSDLSRIKHVGGEKKARHLVKRLGIKEDIFDFETIKNIRKVL